MKKLDSAAKSNGSAQFTMDSAADLRILAEAAAAANDVAALGIAVRMHNADGKDKRRRHGCDGPQARHHADTSGPGFLI